MLLEKCAVRVLEKFPSLKSYFLGEHFRDGRLQRLNEWFSDPLLEHFCLLKSLFLSSQISICYSNISTLHILKLSIECLGRKIVNRIVKPSFLKNITSVADIDLTEESVFLDPKTIFLRGTTKATMNRLLNSCDIYNSSNM